MPYEGSPSYRSPPRKRHTTKKNMNACRKGTLVHAVFIVYAAGEHYCKPTGGRISQLPSRSKKLGSLQDLYNSSLFP